MRLQVIVVLSTLWAAQRQKTANFQATIMDALSQSRGKLPAEMKDGPEDCFLSGAWECLPFVNQSMVMPPTCSAGDPKAASA
jgi:hypothetical protein